METIFLNTLNSKTNEFNKFMYQFTDKLNLKNLDKNMALANLSIYYTWKNIKSKYNNNKFQISAQIGMMNLICLMDLIWFLIQDYFEYIIKKHETVADNFPVQNYVNKIKNRIVFKVKTGHKLELLSEGAMQLLGSSKNVIDKNIDGEIVSRLEAVGVVSVHCNLVNNNYQQAPKVLFTFIPKKQFGQLITITEIWVTNQNNM